MTVVFLIISYLIHLFLIKLKLGFDNKKENNILNQKKINKDEIGRL